MCPGGAVHGAPADGCLGRGPRQIENEFGFLGPNQPYLRHLLASARASLGDDVVIYTTDPPPNLAKGTLPGAEVYSCAPAPPPSPCRPAPGRAAAGRGCRARMRRAVLRETAGGRMRLCGGLWDACGARAPQR
jgi:hypothetical protein